MQNRIPRIVKASLGALVFLAPCLVLYLPAIGEHRFFNPDDLITFRFAPLFYGSRLEAWWNVISHVQAREYLPVGWTFVFWEGVLSGHSTTLIRLCSFVLHLLCCLVVRSICLELTERDRIVSLLTATLYGILPLNVEAVVFVASQFWQLSTLFGLLCLYCFIRSAKKELSRVSYFLSLVFFALALLSKSGITVLPVILAAFLLVYFKLSPRRATIASAPFFALAVLKAFITYAASFDQFPVPAYPGGDPLTSVISHAPLFLRAIHNFFLPLTFVDAGLSLSLSFAYPFSIPGGFLEAVYFVLLGFVGLGILAGLWLLAGRTPAASAAVLWYVASQAFFAGILPGQWWPLADRYSYFGSAGLALLGVLAALRLVRSNGRVGRIGFSVVGGIYLLFLLTLADAQRDIWLNERSFVRQQITILGDDPFRHLIEANPSLEQGLARLQPLPLDEPLTGWDFKTPDFHKSIALVDQPENSELRPLNEYYLALALVAIEEWRKKGHEDRFGAMLRGLLARHDQNPFLGLYGALYFAATDRFEEAAPLLKMWREHPLTFHNRISRLKEQDHGDELHVRLIARGNFVANTEVLHHYWLFLELSYRYYKATNQAELARNTERLYRILFPLILTETKAAR